MKVIVLSKGEKCLVDDDDYEKLIKHKWYCKHVQYGKYAARTYREDGKVKVLYMHRLIMNCPEGFEVHHGESTWPEGTTLDNRKENLKVCSKHENIKWEYEKIKKQKAKKTDSAMDEMRNSVSTISS